VLVNALEIILLAIAVLILLVFIGGLLGARRRDQHLAPEFEQRVRGADRQLQQARASDRGWDKRIMEDACRLALREQRPEFNYDGLHLVLVDDRPGVDEDRAHFVAVGSDGEARVVLSRGGGHWGAESVE
jgi:hypothetical protein